MFGCFKKYAHICSVFSSRYLQSNSTINQLLATNIAPFQRR
ncbi:hypothetical protein BN891_21850 [Bacteroides xylanisolvens SD CC 2a]|nr:hypothetical protein BN891_21850 [Bacteroides xylanisolvens SD CC 2a]